MRIVVDASPLRDSRRHAGIGRYASSMLAALSKHQEIDLHTVMPLLPPVLDALLVRWLNAQPGLALARPFHSGALLHGMASDASLVWPPERQVVTIHDVIPWTVDIPSSATKRHIESQRRRLPRCAAIIAVSPAAANDAINELALDPSRVHVVPEGVDPIFTAVPDAGDGAVRHQLGLPATYVLWVGSLRYHDPRKALDGLLEAMSQVEGASLVMTGAEGEESQRLLGRAAELGVPLVLTGYVSDADLAALYRGAAVVAVPSLHEGFGLPVVEALASGAPVVAARAGNLPALGGGTVVLVPPGDSRALARALSDLLKDRPARARLAAAGPSVAAAYRWSRAAEMTVAVYRTVLNA
jgi:glycosyltransferase involved in cell wall biosynthesis